MVNSEFTAFDSLLQKRDNNIHANLNWYTELEDTAWRIQIPCCMKDIGTTGSWRDSVNYIILETAGKVRKSTRPASMASAQHGNQLHVCVQSRVQAMLRITATSNEERPLAHQRCTGRWERGTNPTVSSTQPHAKIETEETTKTRERRTSVTRRKRCPRRTG